MKNQWRCLAVATVLLTAFSMTESVLADWPQWRGPNRDGYAAPQSLLQQWPEGGPKLKWQYTESGRGYSAVSVVGDMVFTLGASDTECSAICIQLATGTKLWETVISRASKSDDYNHGWGGGPRSTPTVDGDQVFVLSDVGVLAALNKANGEVQWSIDLVKDFGGAIPVWGYSESPLVDGDRVVVTPGNAQFMIAVDRKSGKKVWSSQDTDAPAQYVSIIRGTIGDKSFYVTASKSGLVAFDVQSGAKLFSDTATGNGVAVVPTPLLMGDKLYHTSDYGAGNTLLRLKASDSGIVAESVYALNEKTMQNHHGGVVHVDGVIYGCSKVNGGVWMAQDLETGSTLWEERLKGSGSICFADGRLYCYADKQGAVVLVEPSREGWRPHGTVVLPRQTELTRDKGAIWAHPVIAQQTLIIRDQDLLFAFDIAR
jgi:outer membrane protein assembly factor BamB